MDSPLIKCVLLCFQVYKKLGQTHLALANFSWALDLDPKGANNQIKEALDKRYLPDDDEPATVPATGNTPEDTTGKIYMEQGIRYAVGPTKA